MFHRERFNSLVNITLKRRKHTAYDMDIFCISGILGSVSHFLTNKLPRLFLVKEKAAAKWAVFAG